MKQKKWLTRFLGLLVIGIWGIIVQRIVAGMGDDSAAVIKAELRTGSREQLPVMQPDTFSLLLNYPDPFDVAAEGINADQPASQPAAVKAMPTVIQPVQAPDPFNGIRYLGYILNPQTKKRIAILHNGSTEVMLAEGESTGSVRLISISAEAITVKHQHKTKQIKQNL